jgi:uncharacterized protein YqjF (DUF2071 family)
MTLRNFVPWFKADWMDAVFMHFLVDAELLQRRVPFELDRWEGDAIVSLVAFTQHNLRPSGWGAVGRMLSAPLARHEFLNLRTYVRCGDQRGIFFLAEWIPNRLATLIGPGVYGLPYRLGVLRYRCDRSGGLVAGHVQASGSAFRFRGGFDPSTSLRKAELGSFQHFLIERYAAWTTRLGTHRLFQIDHAPWEFADVRIELLAMDLFKEFDGSLGAMRPLCGQYSPGVRNVLIGAPKRQTLRSELCTLE